ncbi:14240_t:CDS:2, partial [Racocetra persica]
RIMAALTKYNTALGLLPGLYSGSEVRLSSGVLFRHFNFSIGVEEESLTGALPL